LKAGGAVCPLSALAIDVHSSQFLHTLQEIRPDIVIHTCGPFQGQDYHMPRACILAGCHCLMTAGRLPVRNRASGLIVTAGLMQRWTILGILAFTGIVIMFWLMVMKPLAVTS